jgi:hypothetical protein
MTDHRRRREEGWRKPDDFNLLWGFAKQKVQRPNLWLTTFREQFVNDPSNRGRKVSTVRHLQAKFAQHKATLLEDARWWLETKPYDPVGDANAAKDSCVRISDQNREHWTKAIDTGWNQHRLLCNGDSIWKRDLPGLIPPDGMAKWEQECARKMGDFVTQFGASDDQVRQLLLGAAFDE